MKIFSKIRTKYGKLIWGSIAVSPILVLSLIILFSLEVIVINNEIPIQRFILDYIILFLFGWIVLVMTISFIDLFFSGYVPKPKRAKWVLILFLGHIITVILYFYIYILLKSQEPVLDVTYSND